jgi:hypothetical protein
MSWIVAAIVGSGAASAYNGSENRRVASQEADRQTRMAQGAEATRLAEAAAEATRVREAEARRQSNITQGQGEISSLFGQFDDNFYNKRSQSYLDYALPTLDKQYQDQQLQLTSELARSGNLNSSLRGDMFAKLQRQYDTSKLGLTDQANNYAADARAQVAQSKANLTEKNANLADPGLIRTMAEAQAKQVAVNPQYASLGQLISDLSTGVTSSPVSTQKAAGAGINLYNATTGTGSGRVVS